MVKIPIYCKIATEVFSSFSVDHNDNPKWDKSISQSGVAGILSYGF